MAPLANDPKTGTLRELSVWVGSLAVACGGGWWMDSMSFPVPVTGISIAALLIAGMYGGTALLRRRRERC